MSDAIARLDMLEDVLTSSHDDAMAEQTALSLLREARDDLSDGTDRYKCAVCASDLTDPKNSGDPDINGDWVCSQNHCRAVHDVPMTVERTVIRSQNTETERTEKEGK